MWHFAEIDIAEWVSYSTHRTDSFNWLVNTRKNTCKVMITSYNRFFWGDAALPNLGVLRGVGPVKDIERVSNPVRQAEILIGNHDTRSSFPFLGNVCSEYFLNTENSQCVLWMKTQRSFVIFAFSYTKDRKFGDGVSMMIRYSHTCCRPRVKKQSSICEIQKGHLEK